MSGEALSGDGRHAIDIKILDRLANEIKELMQDEDVTKKSGILSITLNW